MKEEPKYMTPAEVAEHWRVNQRTVMNWIRRGQLDAVYIGARYRIAREDAMKGPRPKEA